ncbi:PARP14 [Bugula neritina]|uniref:PARP14 n=1 Tax=Bugula neritina TaxID=10212 RepID=A0A7J7J8J3_BUGNE|nr:PARP14 [Bugula neritina]
MVSNSDTNPGDEGVSHSDSANSTAWLEVYEFPADCLAAELSYHFSCSPFFAKCVTPLNRMWNPTSSTFVLEFSSSDAEKIMKKPTQLLEVDDPRSKILISHWEARRSTQVLVSSEHELSLRMVRNYFKGFGEIEECVHQPLYVIEDYRIIVTFKQADVAVKVAAQSNHQIGPAVTVKTLLLKDDDYCEKVSADEPSSPSGTSFSLNFDFDSVSSIIPPYKPSKVEGGQPNHSIPPLSGPRANVYEEVKVEGNPLTLGGGTQAQDASNESHIYETISILSTEPPFSDVKEVPASANQQAPAQPVSPPPVQHALIPIPLVPPVSLQCCIQVNNCVVRLVRGDLSKHAAEVLIHSRGSVADMLYRKCNTANTFSKLVQTVNLQPTGSIAISTAPNLPARYLFCFRLVNGDGGASQLKYVKACLQQCSRMRVRSAAFPALGTGNYGMSAKLMSTVLTKGIVEYMSGQSHSSLEIIDIVIYDQHLLEDYATSMKKAATASAPRESGRFISRTPMAVVENVYQVPKKSNSPQN